ncbi:hypothetical protein CI109_105602 [Kwoniella shandongensis]|uniref:Uncharacterized protein n=1 Tax=Kwoniella shandongensis TaxID=1734106 RepID=A0A5M6C2S1_9TREE|nr:uncharacterized protein CI109_002319 [Kwoniella shandongensis]KAA5529426.1 hypothetical protein CI109_002319 [Kwoniella shandongensis]
MSDEILRNSAALNALKRHQLVSLSKRYGLRASGKNVELVERLQEYAITHANDLDFYIPEPAPTPGPSVFSSPNYTSEPISPMPTRLTSISQTLAPTPLNHKFSQASIVSRRSEAWEVLSDSGASMISPRKEEDEPERGMSKSASVSSWKSANNGEAMLEFGGHHHEQPRSTSSMKALATSLTRRGSRILLGRSVSASSHLSVEAEQPVQPQAQNEPETVEEIADIPPSPASTVGVPKRHSSFSLLERPSTIRLCSPTPASPGPVTSVDEADDLPFFGKGHAVKERRSMAPLRSPTGPAAGFSNNALTRKSMPALHSNTQSASLSSIYPPLPSIPAEYAKPTPIPGAFPPLPPTPSSNAVIFGSSMDAGVSNKQFSEAAQAILREMNSKLPDGSVKFGEEYLKGKKAEIDKLVHVNKELGTGGWGLGEGHAAIRDRYAEAHQKEFAKMRSISKSSVASKPPISRTGSSASTDGASTHAAPKRKHDLTSSTSSATLPSAPNGLPLHASEDRQRKKSRLSSGPHYLGSLREAGKSLAHILVEDKAKPSEAALKRMKERRDKRRSSMATGKGRNLTSRFGFLRKKTTQASDATALASSTSSAMSPPATIPPPTMPRKTSVYAPRDPPQPRRKFDLDASLARKPSRRNSSDLTNVIKRNPEILEPIKSSEEQGKAQKDRGRSTSAQTMLSQSSNAPRRPRIPDFAPPGNNKAASASVNTLGLPISQSMSSSLASSMKKQSQADLIRNARPAPPPPTTTTARPPTINRSSTLYLPTASSLARMQATVRPTPERPLPAVPSPAVSQNPRFESTVQPFGNASSRDNHLFESNFHSVPKPALAPKTAQFGNGGGKTPIKGSLAAARARAKASGLSAVKSRGNLREEMEIKRKRSEIKARQERIGEERELREMLRG